MSDHQRTFILKYLLFYLQLETTYTLVYTFSCGEICFGFIYIILIHTIHFLPTLCLKPHLLGHQQILLTVWHPFYVLVSRILILSNLWQSHIIDLNLEIGNRCLWLSWVESWFCVLSLNQTILKFLALRRIRWISLNIYRPFLNVLKLFGIWCLWLTCGTIFFL